MALSTYYTETQQVLKKLQENRLPQIEMEITRDEFRTAIQLLSEKTSTTPSGRT
jgi:hypothetical protein